jgi:LysM repeat protein
MTMTRGLIYLLAAIFLSLIISIAVWTIRATESQGPGVYTVKQGESAESIAESLGVTTAQLAEANDASATGFDPQPGEVIKVPAPAADQPSVWVVHAIGVCAEMVGVLLSFWLALVAGLLPKGLRTQVLGISVALGIASYAAAQGVAPGDPLLTPQFVFAAIKDGFAWSAAFPMFAAAFGLARAVGKREEATTE